MRIALGLEYDGSSFCGWQTQERGGSVQDVLESALSVVANSPVRVVCAGRTDAGVHALTQVVHFDTNVVRPDTAWVRGTNVNLPRSVVVRWSKRVGDDFHARFSARGRHYRYFLLNRTERPGIFDKRVGWYHRPLDVNAMQSAADLLLGEHDFSAFRAAECQAKSPVKTMRRAQVVRHGDMLHFDFEATAFLHHMVRNVVGSLIYVGKGTHSLEWFANVFASRNRSLAAPTFSPCGLYLAGVSYEPEWGLRVGAGDTVTISQYG